MVQLYHVRRGFIVKGRRNIGRPSGKINVLVDWRTHVSATMIPSRWLFLFLLENLTPPERAVFLLREVFDYTYEEIADILGKSEVACRKLFSRAKKYISSNRPPV